MQTCFNHPDKKAFSICHNCGNDYCEQCLSESRGYYYCAKPECQAALEKEKNPEGLPIIICPNCDTEIQLTKEESAEGIIRCPECDKLINFHSSPPLIVPDINYVELVTTFNQADVAIIKSLLDSCNIDYYGYDENYSRIDPGIQPIRFFVKEEQLQEAKDALKDVNQQFFTFKWK